jgi:hypothetical protein
MKKHTAFNDLAGKCHLSIMESMLVWEFILLCHRQRAELGVLETGLNDSAMHDLIRDRLDVIQGQCTLAEQLITQALLPLPKARSHVSGEKVAVREHFACAAVVRATVHRIGALSYIMKSQIVNQPLRRLAALWIGEEACLFSEQVLFFQEYLAGVLNQPGPQKIY